MEIGPGAPTSATASWQNGDGGDWSQRLIARQQLPAWIGPAVRWLANLLLFSALVPLVLCSFWLFVAMVGEADSVLGTWIIRGLVFGLFMTALAFYLLGPALLLSPIVAPVALLWRRPLRVLLLRPFNRATSTRYLRRVATRVLAPLGHIYTLSDREIRTRWYRRIPFLFGELQLFSFRSRTLKSERDVARLSRVFSRTFLRNLDWFLSRDHIFPLRAHDEVWVATVEAAIRACDLVVIDLTDRRPAVVKEVEICRRFKSLNDVVFIVHQDQYAETRHFLVDTLLAAKTPILTYQDNTASLDSLTTELALLVGFAEPKRSAWRTALFAFGLASAGAFFPVILFYLGSLATSRIAPSFVAAHSTSFESVLSIYDSAVMSGDSKTAANAERRLKSDFRLQLLHAMRERLTADRFDRVQEGLRHAPLAIIKWNASQDDGPLLVSLLQHLLADSIPTEEAYRSAVAVVETALAIHADPWPYVRGELEQANDFRWQRMVALVARFSDRGSVPALVRCLNEFSKRSDAAATLAALDAHEAVPALLRHVEERGFLSSGEGPVRDALDKLVGSSTVPALLTELGAGASNGRAYATEALARLKDRRALPSLIQLIPNHDAETAANAIVGAEDIAIVCHHVHDRNEGRRAWANATFARLFAIDRRLRCGLRRD